MSFRNIRPLHILWQEGITQEMLQGVFYGVMRILYLAGVFEEFKFNLHHLGQQRQPDWHQGSVLNPYKSLDGYIHWSRLNPHRSLDWYIRWARINSKKEKHLNSKALLDALAGNPICKAELRYELVVVNEPLHLSSTSQREIGGIARTGQGTVITTHDHLHLLQSLWRRSRKNTQKRQSEFFLSTQMRTIHELGHVFGLFPGTSKENPSDEEIKKTHCQKNCVMYWQLNTELLKKIELSPFCPDCLEKLKQFFIEP